MEQLFPVQCYVVPGDVVQLLLDDSCLFNDCVNINLQQFCLLVICYLR